MVTNTSFEPKSAVSWGTVVLVRLCFGLLGTCVFAFIAVWCAAPLSYGLALDAFKDLGAGSPEAHGRAATAVSFLPIVLSAILGGMFGNRFALQLVPDWRAENLCRWVRDTFVKAPQVGK